MLICLSSLRWLQTTNTLTLPTSLTTHHRLSVVQPDTPRLLGLSQEWQFRCKKMLEVSVRVLCDMETDIHILSPPS